LKEKNKIFKTYFFLLSLSIIILFSIIFFFYNFTITQEIVKLKYEKKVILNLIKKDIENEFINYIDDIRFLSETPQLKSLIYKESNISENRDYLKDYLKIKDKYFAGIIRDNKNNIIIEEYRHNDFLKFSEIFLVEPPKEITITTLGAYKDSTIIKITAPLIGENGKIIGTISLFGKQGYLDDILEKYNSSNFITDSDLYWFTLNAVKEPDPIQKTKILDKNDFLPLKKMNGSEFYNKSLYTFVTLNFKKLIPNLDFTNNTDYIWRLVIKVPNPIIISIKRRFLKEYFFFGTIFFIFLSLSLWRLTQEIQKRKFYEEKLEIQNQQLIQENKNKDKFFSILAHDLKGPFTGITGIFTMLTRKYDNYDDAKKKKLIFSLKDSIQGINTLLINLLEWTRIERGLVSYSPIKVKVNDIITSTYSILKLNLEEKEIKFINNISDKYFIWVDKNMVEAIFRNIISNSIKFTHPMGKIELFAKKTEDYIIISISDDGIGMSEEIKSKLFKLNEHHSSVGTQNEKGTGLGLIITKEFITLNRGILEVCSTLGKGTTFIIKFPIHKDI
jgi:signal transduction histidine kinase